MNADTLTMLCIEGDVEANDSFRRQFSLSCNVQNVAWKVDDSACSFALSLSLERTVVGGRNLLSGSNKFSWC